MPIINILAVYYYKAHILHEQKLSLIPNPTKNLNNYFAN